MTPTLRDYQLLSTAELQKSLLKHRVAADGSDTGTGKTYKVCADAAHRGVPLVVVTKKSVVPDWLKVAADFDIPCQAINYDKVRTGKTQFGHWEVKGKVFRWTLPAGTQLVFDEAHACGGLQTQTSALLIAATRQGIPRALLSATLLDSPLKSYAIGYALGLHSLTNFWQWARRLGVRDGFYGPEWTPEKLDPPQTEKQVMEAIRVALGDKFTRIRKADVPNFPRCQNIPTFVQTDDMPDTIGDYSMEARRTVELLKVPGLVERAKGLIEEGMSVAIFVNFRATRHALREAFPESVSVYGGQSPEERSGAIVSFQRNEAHVILLMAQAGGTGVSLHDLHGRPRAALICPGYNSKEFLQVLGRIHRDGSLSAAINYLIFASGVPVERRIRARLEAKLTNLTALNDYDLIDHDNTQPIAPGSPPTLGGVPHDAQPAHADESHRADSPHDGHAPAAGNDVDERGACGDRREGAAHPEGCLASAGGADPGRPGQPGNGPGSQSARAPGERDDLGPGRPSDLNQSMTPAIDIVATPVLQQVSTSAEGNHVVRKHARSSPSKLKNLEICPSYEGDNDGPVHPVTLRGTAMHEALETGNDLGLDPSAETGPPGTEKALVEMCREFQNAETVPGEFVLTEPHLKTHDRDVQGFADRVVLEPANAAGRRKARIRDYKMGFNLVDLPNINPQAIAYTVAVFIEYVDVDEINFAFLIPRQDAVLEHTFHRSELPALKLRLSVIADRVRKLAGKEFNLVDSNCLYCGRKATCPEATNKVLPIRNAFTEADRLPLPSTFDFEKLTEPQDVAYMLNLANMAEDWAAKAKSFALRYRLELGQEVPGYDLVERKGKREVTDPNAAFAVAQEFGVTMPQFIAAARVSITSLETSVKEHAGQGDKAAAADRFTDRLMDANAISRGGSFNVLQRSRKKKAPAITG